MPDSSQKVKAAVAKTKLLPETARTTFIAVTLSGSTFIAVTVIAVTLLAATIVAVTIVAVKTVAVKIIHSSNA